MYHQIRDIMNSGSILGYFFQAVPITCFVGAVYAVLRWALIKKKQRRTVWPDEIMKFLFVCYLTGLISLVILPANFWLRFLTGLHLDGGKKWVLFSALAILTLSRLS